jgi:cytochrome c-type biogenesis protein CcmH/NrfG
MDIPSPLRNAVESGTAVLLLGSGASLAARDPTGKRPPTAAELARLLCGKFLSAAYERHPLTQVADYAISESSLFDVQDFIREIFLPFKPSKSHLLLPTFRWRAIITTNYDRLIEDAYAAHRSPAQRVVPLFQNTDRWDDVTRDKDAVPLLKLHGCISKTHDARCPLILSTEQYITYNVGRSRLFRLFQELAAERTFLYIGFSNTDPDIRSLVHQLDTENVGRPRSFLITPSVDSIAERYWSPRQITALAGTLDDAITSLDSTIGKAFRGFRPATPTGTNAISERFTYSVTALSENACKALSLDIEYVKAATPESPCDAHRFYSGVSQKWAPIVQSLDVRRRLHDTLLSDYFLNEDPGEFRFLVIKAHAGAGKSVFLRRLAWEASHEFNRLCLYASADASLSSAVLQELANATKEHLYLFVDDVVQHRSEIDALIHSIGSATWLTIIGAARTNEWNGTPPAYQSLVSDEHSLPYLSEKELDELVGKLEANNALNELGRLPPSERRDALRQKAGRQLLVALHEATSGRRFEEILHDEFSRLTPNRLKTIYLAICFLNQFNVPVRAGLISRRFGITFEAFRQELFRPLEEVVVTDDRKGTDDYSYSARHSHVAEIVVRNELGCVDDLYNEYILTLQQLNLGYASDKQAFQRLLQGKRLAFHFPNPQLAYNILKAAEEAMGNEDPYLLQQMALYEMNRDSGHLGKATQFLQRAMNLAPRSRIVKHSLAELYLKQSGVARNDLERLHSIAEAEQICRELKRDTHDSYAHSTLVKAGILRLQRAADSEEVLKNEDVEGLIKSVERDLKEGLQRFPGDAHLLALEADLAKLLCESERFAAALKLSFAKNPRNGYVALRLSRVLEQRNDIDGALKALKDALDANRANDRLHFAYAKLMMVQKVGTNEDLVYHFKHSFTRGDANYEAQLLYGRQLFVAGRFDEVRDTFAALKRVKLPNVVKRRQIYPLDGTFEGVVERSEAWYCLIRRDGDGASVSFDEDDSGGVEWKEIGRHTRVRFRIAFTMFGPEAFSVELL